MFTIITKNKKKQNSQLRITKVKPKSEPIKKDAETVLPDLHF